MAYIIEDNTGRMLDGGQTRKQVLSAYQRLIQDPRATLPKLPRRGHSIVIGLPSAMAQINKIDYLRIVVRG